MLKSGGDLKRFTLCPFVAGVRLWSDSLENKEGVNLITKSRQASRIGERVPHWENNSPFRIIRKQLRDAGLGCGDGREPFQLPISRPPPSGLWSKSEVRKQSRCQLLSRKSGWSWPQHKLALRANPGSPQGLCHCSIYFVDNHNQELEMEGRSLQFGQEHTGRNELPRTMPLTQDAVQELMTNPRGIWGWFCVGTECKKRKEVWFQCCHLEATKEIHNIKTITFLNEQSFQNPSLSRVLSAGL